MFQNVVFEFGCGHCQFFIPLGIQNIFDAIVTRNEVHCQRHGFGAPILEQQYRILLTWPLFVYRRPHQFERDLELEWDAGTRQAYVEVAFGIGVEFYPKLVFRTIRPRALALPLFDQGSIIFDAYE